MAYKYNSNYEDAFGKQLDEMLDMCDTDYYEIWIGTDGYAVSHPGYKVYDAYEDDDTLIQEELGITFDQLMNLVVLRAGCAYQLSPEFYEETTGEPFPQEVADQIGKNAIVVMVVSLEDARERIRMGKTASDL